MLSAKILLVHVVDDMRTMPGMEQPKASYPLRMDSAEEALRKVAAGLSYDVVRYATIVRAGSIRETIAALIDERDADLLVIGTRRKISRTVKDWDRLPRAAARRALSGSDCR